MKIDIRMGRFGAISAQAMSSLIKNWLTTVPLNGWLSRTSERRSPSLISVQGAFEVKLSGGEGLEGPHNFHLQTVCGPLRRFHCLKTLGLTLGNKPYHWLGMWELYQQGRGVMRWSPHNAMWVGGCMTQRRDAPSWSQQGSNGPSQFSQMAGKGSKFCLYLASSP